MKKGGRKGKGWGRKKHLRRLDRKKRGQEMDKSVQTKLGESFRNKVQVRSPF